MSTGVVYRVRRWSIARIVDQLDEVLAHPNADWHSPLLAIRAAPERFTAIWHPLGFLQIEIERSDSRSLLVNVWSALAGHYCGAGLGIHKHDWTLRSRVLCGQLVEEHWGAIPHATGTHRIFTINYAGHINTLVRTPERVAAKVEATRTVGPGVSYALEAGRFHRIIPAPGSTTATVIEAVRQRDVRNEVLGPLNGAPSYTTERIPCDPGSLATAIDLVLQSIEEG